AVDRIAKHSFNRVLAQQSEEMRRLDFPQLFVLLFGRETIEALQALQSFAVSFLGRRFSLISEFRRGIFVEGTFRIAVAVASIWAGELAVDVNYDAGFFGSRAGIVAREDARRRGGDD